LGHQTFLLSQLKEHFIEEDSMGAGAIFNSVTKKDLHSLQLFSPIPKVVEQFEALAEPVWQLIRVLSAKNTNLRAQRDLLLPKLISGEIDVSEAERNTKQVA